MPIKSKQHLQSSSFIKADNSGWCVSTAWRPGDYLGEVTVLGRCLVGGVPDEPWKVFGYAPSWAGELLSGPFKTAIPKSVEVLVVKGRVDAD
jgi:hypothetical protein